MHKILYSSRARTAIDEDELQEILRVSRRNNEAAGVTGILLHYPATDRQQATFLQVLEGERDTLESVYARISEDPRHDYMKLLSSEDTVARRFGDWTMGLQYVTDEDLQHVLPGFAPDDPDAVRVQHVIENAPLAEMLLMMYVV